MYLNFKFPTKNKTYIILGDTGSPGPEGPKGFSGFRGLPGINISIYYTYLV